MTEIKSCSCGGKAELRKTEFGFFVICENCLCQTQETVFEEDAIKLWNSHLNPWHTGTPTEEIQENDWYTGWYTFAYKCHGEVRYITIKEPSLWYFTNCDTLAWQKVEPFEASKENT